MENNIDSIIRDIKKEFFAFRNGIVADTMRKVTPYSVIFGLQVPQLADIARRHEASMALADALWADSNVRESRLLATYLFPINEITPGKALELASQTLTKEEADMLAFRLLKRLDFAGELLTRMKTDSRISEYMVQSLANHLS